MPKKRARKKTSRTAKDAWRDIARQRETRFVGRNLTQKQAFRIAAKKNFKFRYDHRGASYDPKTGKITYT